MKLNNRSLSVIALAIILFTPVLFAAPAWAAGQTYTLTVAQATEGGYAKESDVDVSITLKWEGLAADQDVDITLWNSTDQLDELEANKTIIYGGNAKGTYSATYQDISGLTEKLGTFTYYVKVLDDTSGAVLASKAFTVYVAAESMELSVGWQDTNNDRIVSIDESVLFTAYINWAFQEAQETHSLWVKVDDSQAQNKGSILVTTGSGSATSTFSLSWNTAGTKNVVVSLKDAQGSVVASKTIPVNVGAATGTTTPSGAATQAGIVSLITANWQILAIAAAGIIIVVVYTRKDKKGKK